MNLGITQYSAAVGEFDLLARAKQIGLAAVEPMIATATSPYLQWNRAQCARYKDEAATRGISIPSSAMAIFNGDPSLVSDDGCDQAVNYIQASLEFSAAIGSKVLLVCTYFASAPDTPLKKAALRLVLETAAPLAQRFEVAIALESPLPANELRTLVDDIKSPFVGVYYDVGNAIYLGFDPAAEIIVLGSRILAVHIKDTKRDIGDAHLGEGRLDLDAVIQMLKRIGYDGCLMLETPPDGSNAGIVRDIQLLKTLL